MPEKKSPEEKKVVVIDPEKIEELQKELNELKSQAAQPTPEVSRKIVNHNGGKLDPNKNYVVIETGKWKTIEAGINKLPAIPVEPEKPKAPSNAPYLITIVVMIAIGVSGALYYLSIRPEADFVVVVGAMFLVITPITTSIMAFMQSRDTNKAVNSRLDSFIESERKANLAEGKDRGRRDAEDRADVLAAQ